MKFNRISQGNSEHVQTRFATSVQGKGESIRMATILNLGKHGYE